MFKSKLELMVEEKFDFIDKDDEFYLVSKDFLSENDRDKLVIAVESRDNGEILVSSNVVKSLALQNNDTIEHMLGYYPDDTLTVEDVLSNNEHYEDGIIYVDLLEDGYYEELNLIIIKDKCELDIINHESFWQDSSILINYVLEVMQDILMYSNFANDLLIDIDENMSRYLVVVLKEFCLDGQIVSSEYAIDRKNSDFVDINDYDKRDFFGDFSLGIFEGLNQEQVIEDVARSYDFEEEMLKAYKLASK